MLLVLTGVTAISVALLAYVNELTKEPIAQANAKTLSDAVSAVVPGFDNDPIAEKKTQEVNGVQYAVYPATKEGKFIGAAVEATSMGFGGELKVLVGFDAEGKIIDYSLLSHVETPGLGSKAADWFKKGNKGDITGMNPGEASLTVSKDGGKVDAITASTITSRAFLNAVNVAYAAYAGQNTADGATGATQKNVEEAAGANTATGATIKVELTDSVSAKSERSRDMNNFTVLMNGIVKENPTFVLLLGMCPTLGTTSSAINGMGMGLATMFVLICSNVVISAIKNLIPDMVRIPSFIVVIASFVTLLQMVMQAYVPALYATLGLFIPLIVVNCIVLGRAEAFAAKNNPVASFFDGLGMGLGFTIALTLLGAVREFLGTGKIFNLTILPEEYGMLVFVLAPGAFIALGYLIALVNSFKKA